MEWDFSGEMGGYGVAGAQKWAASGCFEKENSRFFGKDHPGELLSGIPPVEIFFVSDKMRKIMA